MPRKKHEGRHPDQQTAYTPIGKIPGYTTYLFPFQECGAALVATYSQYFLVENFLSLFPMKIIGTKVNVQASDTIATVMKQFCKPIPLIQGLIPYETAKPRVFRMMITDIMDSPAISFLFVSH